jgi:DNA-binding transcriptional MerR regulator/methylmalonyl-CoA mutase cobalamin-binding subunit
MSRTKQSPAQSAAAAATIAMVERETGLSKDTLRMWERRYGFPLPQRDSRGERAYPPDQVEKLRVISRLLRRGMRPGQLINVPLAELIERLHADETALPTDPGRGLDGALAPMLEEAMALLQRYDEPGLRSHLSMALWRLGLRRFVIEFVDAMNVRVGDAWCRGEFTVSHEHLYAEQMQHLLRQGIGSIAPGERQPSVLLTTLPGEEHQLGLLMAHVCLAAEGARCISLGVQTPAADIAQAVRGQAIDVVALSFSEALTLHAAHDMLEDLRARLPAPIQVWAGGKLWARARQPVPGVRFITRLTQIPEALAAHTRSRA